MSTPSGGDTAAPATSFAKDIAPIFAPFRDNMLWRFDLTDYDAVVANAGLIEGFITPSGGSSAMPPAPLPPLEPFQVQLFKTWIAQQCPP
jgi:hypothetical protein